MIALFWYSPIPAQRRTVNRDGSPGFFLDGETSEDLAWDLVEMFFDGFMTQEFLRGLAFEGITGPGTFIMDASEYDPNMLRTNRYHEQRFTDAWWLKKEWMLMDFFGGSTMSSVQIKGFKRQFSEETILMIHLTVLIGRYFARHHGYPEQPLTAQVALDYFEEHGYLKRLPEGGTERQKILAGDLRPLW